MSRRRPHRRLVGRVLAAAGCAWVLCLAGATPVSATSPTRQLAASLVAEQVGHHGLRGPATDQAMVLGAWRDAGVDIRRLATPDELMHACLPLVLGAPRPAGPAPGDYLLYRDTAGTPRIGMFLSPVDVAVVDQGAVATVLSPELEGAIGDATVPRLLAQAGSAQACRLAPSRWPGGHDDVSAGAGRIALADPERIAEQLGWAADHPRDADTSPLHTVTRLLATVAVGLSCIATELVKAVFDAAHWVLERTGPVGAPFLLLGSVLGRTFDGRRLHAVLTGVVLAALAVAVGAGWILPFGWVLVGAVLAGAAAAHAGVPVLGAIGGALVGAAFATASFLTGVLTGVDNSDRVCVGTVLFSLVADVLWLRPAMAALGAVAHARGVTAGGRLLTRVEGLSALRTVAGDGPSMLDVSGTTADALSLRPHALIETLRSIATGQFVAHDAGSAAARAMAAAPPMHRALSAAEAMGAVGRRGLDLVSLTWRPSSVSSDMVGHAADALHFLDTEMRSGLPSLPRLRRLLLAMQPHRRQALLDAMAHSSTHLVPQMQITARLSHLHSGARTLTGIATGQRQQRFWWAAWRSPVLRHRLRWRPGGGDTP